MKIYERKIQEISGSLLISLPRSWADASHLKKGATLKISIEPNGSARLTAGILLPKEKKERVIVHDEYFIRQLFNAYFAGYEQIIIRFEQKNTREAKREVYAFLKKFMNMQIIEDTEKKIVLKSFKIEEISIEDCLNRMFYISLSIIDEASSSAENLDELKTTLKRFYYLLVMQIRRFIGEGKFAEKNQITLLRALDFRMVGEKIDEIGNLAASLKVKDDSSKAMLKDIKEFYKKAYSSFMNGNFEKSLQTWGDDVKIDKKYSSLINKLSKEEIQEVLKLQRMNYTIRKLAMLSREYDD